MLWSSGFWVVELLEGFGHISPHGEVNLPFDVVPIERNAYVTRACPIGGDSVVFFEDSEQVIHMFMTGVLDSEIIDH